MLTPFKSFTFGIAVAAFVFGSLITVEGADPNERLWQKQHPGSNQSARMSRTAPQSYRSFSYEPAAPLPNVQPAVPLPNPAPQTTRSFSHEPMVTPAAQPAAPVAGCTATLNNGQPVRSFSYEPAPMTIRSFSYEPETITPFRWAPAPRALNYSRPSTNYMERKVRVGTPFGKN